MKSLGWWWGGGQNVSVSLLGPDTNFDTLLSVYDKVRQGNTTVLNQVACNDNSQSSIQSAIFLLPLIKNHTYMIVSFLGQVNLSTLLEWLHQFLIAVGHALSGPLWMTLIRLWLHSLSFKLLLWRFSLQFYRYVVMWVTITVGTGWFRIGWLLGPDCL
jgi:hypothetical protein